MRFPMRVLSREIADKRISVSQGEFAEADVRQGVWFRNNVRQLYRETPSPVDSNRIVRCEIEKRALIPRVWIFIARGRARLQLKTTDSPGTVD